MTPKIGYAAIALSSLCFGFLGSMGKFGFALGYTPLSLLTVRFTLAALMMWTVAMVVGIRKYAVTPKFHPWLVAQGVAYATTSLGFFIALQHLPAGLVSIVFYIHPLITMVAANLLWKERLGRTVLIAALLAVLGTALVSQDGTTNLGNSLGGFAWVTFSALSYSAFTLLGQKSTNQQNALVVTTYSITYCALFLILLNPPLYIFDGSLTLDMWLIGLFIGLVSSALAILLYIVGVKAVGAAKASIASALEPLSGVFIAALLLDERLQMLQWFGVLAVILAVLYLQTGANQEAPRA